jgi:hypothetical protein
MSRCARAPAIARLTVKWLDHSQHRPEASNRCRISELLTHENFTMVDALEFRAVLSDELEERHRRHMLLRAWTQVKSQGYLQSGSIESGWR